VPEPRASIPRVQPDAGRTDPSEAFRELHTMLLGAPLQDVLEQVAALASTTVPGVDEASVTLVEGEHARTAAFTGDAALALDERQYERDYGPCLDAAQTGGLVVIPDTGADQTYPVFALEAKRVGVTHTLSAGLPVAQRTIGAINLYGRDGRGFPQESLELATAFASYAAVAIANAALYSSAVRLAEQMREALASRAVIEQAKGMIMAARGCSADEAFLALTRASQHSNRKLRLVAEDLVARRVPVP
jgi:GAF domain-containing protein